MFYYIYKITNINTQKIYIGSHQTSNLEDGYFGSGIYLKRSIAKYGIEHFKKEILEFCSSREKMHIRETEILQLTQHDDTYNLKHCALGGNTRAKYTAEQKTAYIKKLIENPNSPIGKSPTKGKKLSESTRAKMKIKRKEFFENITPEQHEKWKTNIVKSSKPRCALMSEINRKPVRVMCIETDEITFYKSKTDCAAALGVDIGTLTLYISGMHKRKTTNIKKLLLFVIQLCDKQNME